MALLYRHFLFLSALHCLFAINEDRAFHLQPGAPELPAADPRDRDRDIEIEPESLGATEYEGGECDTLTLRHGFSSDGLVLLRRSGSWPSLIAAFRVGLGA